MQLDILSKLKAESVTVSVPSQCHPATFVLAVLTRFLLRLSELLVVDAVLYGINHYH